MPYHLAILQKKRKEGRKKNLPLNGKFKSGKVIMSIRIVVIAPRERKRTPLK
jgi:hypothetical protein